MGMKLHADGSGLFRIEAQGCEGVEVRIAGDSEESIFEKLELPYEEPEKRE
jgi:DNA polymerase/3'-5' exonuclease PolX